MWLKKTENAFSPIVHICCRNTKKTILPHRALQYRPSSGRPSPIRPSTYRLHQCNHDYAGKPRQARTRRPNREVTNTQGTPLSATSMLAKP